MFNRNRHKRQLLKTGIRLLDISQCDVIFTSQMPQHCGQNVIFFIDTVRLPSFGDPRYQILIELICPYHGITKTWNNLINDC